MNFKDILRESIKITASDIHLAVGRSVTFRVDGVLRNLDNNILTAEDVKIFIESIAPRIHLENLAKKGGSDFSYTLEGGSSFRVSIFKQKNMPSCVLRLIPSKVIAWETLGLSDKVKELLNQQRGLILITGPTGSGKSTTLASMIDYINSHRKCNIITIEDPIEYRHKHKESIVVQRELGQDVYSFNEAVVKALRQDPDVILVGEMRDYETIEAALRAAETGHLVISTLHTNGAARTIERVVDIFPVESRSEIRTQLAGVLLGVISQQLLPLKNKEGRRAAFELMFNTTSIAACIRENKTYRITSDIQTGSKYGMKTMDASLLELYLAQEIDYKLMMDRCYDKDFLEKLLLDQGTKKKGFFK